MPKIKKKKKKTEASPLQGEALLERVRELEDLSKEEKALECGYYRLNNNGSKRVSLVRFMNALVDAEGIDLDGHCPDEFTRRERTASFRIRVQTNGILSISSVYTKKLNLNPGDEFELELGRNHIKLIQVETTPK
jgi:AbrB-like transcriptional regulator